MEITLRIDGKNKTFKQDKVTFKTIYMSLQWIKRYQEELALMKESLERSIEEENPLDNSQQIDPFEDLEFTAKLVVEFFGHQFTYDEFVNGAMFNNIYELHEWGQKISEFIHSNKTKSDKDAKKKLTPMKPI